MGKSPRLTGKEVLRALQKLGFEVTRIKGSHHILKHSDCKSVTVPVHRNEYLGIGLLSQIVEDSGYSREEIKRPGRNQKTLLTLIGPFRNP